MNFSSKIWLSGAMVAFLAGCGSTAGDDEPHAATGGGGVGGSGGNAGTTATDTGGATGGTSATAGAGGGGNAGTSVDGGSGGSSSGDARADVSTGDATVDGRSSDGSVSDASDASDAKTVFDAVGDGPSSSRQTPHPLGTTSATLGYYEYVPPGYGDGAKRPILFFFHGVGENGNGTTDLSKVLVNGPPKLISMNQWPSDRPFIVLSGQHHPVTGTPDPVYGGNDCWTPVEVHDFVAFGIAHYTIDAQRIYITGLSCGAMGSGNYFKQYGAQQGVAAAVLISGNANIFWPAQGCSLVQQMGLWAFHGDADNVVPITGDNAAMPQFQACAMSRKDVRYTVYPGVDHDAWTRTYDLTAGNDIYSWLLGITR
jgi:predicted esterase